jgi:hypothetical protein
VVIAQQRAAQSLTNSLGLPGPHFLTRRIMIVELSEEDIAFLIGSMKYTKKAFRETGIAPHGSYPSYEYKQARLAEAQAVLDKLYDARRKDKVDN